MANFKIGDKVKILSSRVVLKIRTGVIVAKKLEVGYGAKHGSLFSGAKPKGKILTWWQVKLDVTGETEEIADDELEKIE